MVICFDGYRAPLNRQNLTSRSHIKKINQNFVNKRKHFSFNKNKTQTAVTNICLNCIPFVCFVTTYIIRSDYYSVTDKFKFENTTVRG